MVQSFAVFGRTLFCPKVSFKVGENLTVTLHYNKALRAFYHEDSTVFAILLTFVIKLQKLVGLHWFDGINEEKKRLTSDALSQWSATTGPRPGAGPCEVCYRSVCVFRINALSLKHFYNVKRNIGTFL